MCGIVGAFALRDRLDDQVRRALPRMTQALQHRGPDAGGCHADDYVALGHRRLSIIDLGSGHQPMSNEDGTCWIVFNGEIYNHHELAKELKSRGHQFRTRSDTEVIVHAYEEFGVACVERLEGMFAFAIYDQRSRQLFLARDRLGKKPLFYAQFGDVFHFASEIKALRQSPLWNGELDLSMLEAYLSLGYVPAPRTMYRHIQKLEPGHWLQVRDGRSDIRKYWDVTEFDTDHRSESDLVADLEQLLQRAVEQRLESDVPLGAFLSSGIDSGLVVSYMSDALSSEILAATVGFRHKRFNEIDGAAMVAERFNARHVTQIVEPQLDDLFDRLVQACDEPFADDSMIPTYYVCQMARQHITVALSGDGGDESFGGYDFRYVPHAWECRARRCLPGSAGRSVMAAAARRWPRSRRLPRPLRLSTVFENLARDAEQAYFLDLCFVKPPDSRALLGADPVRDPRHSAVYDAVVEPYRRCASSSPLQRAQYADLKIYLPNMPLVKVDRLSMLHGLEVRCPLLDHRIVEFAFRVPTARKMPRLRPKHLLRQLASNRLPDALLNLPKQGFSAPIGDWIKGPCVDLFRDEVLSGQARVASLLDHSVVRRFFDQHAAGSIDRTRSLWAVWVLERWLRLQEGGLSASKPTDAAHSSGRDPLAQSA